VRIGRERVASPRVAAVFAILAVAGAALHLHALGSALNEARKQSATGSRVARRA
jgi:hypothetical protein